MDRPGASAGVIAKRNQHAVQGGEKGVGEGSHRLGSIHLPEEDVELVEDEPFGGVELFDLVGGKRAIQHEVGHHAEVRVVPNQIRDVGVADVREGPLFVVFDHGRDEGRNLAGAAEERLDKERLLVGKIPVNGSMGDARFPGDVADTHAIERFDREYPFGRIDDDILTGLLLAVFQFCECGWVFHECLCAIFITNLRRPARKKLDRCNQWLVL